MGDRIALRVDSVALRETPHPQHDFFIVLNEEMRLRFKLIDRVDRDTTIRNDHAGDNLAQHVIATKAITEDTLCADLRINSAP